MCRWRKRDPDRESGTSRLIVAFGPGESEAPPECVGGKGRRLRGHPRTPTERRLLGESPHRSHAGDPLRSDRGSEMLPYGAVDFYAVAQICFWGCIAALCYIWVGYPFLLFVASMLVGRGETLTKRGANTISASILLTVHNGEEEIAEQLTRLLSLVGPPSLDDIMVASDGSTDMTNRIVESFGPAVRLIAVLPQRGKTGAQNVAIAQCHSDVVFFMDLGVRFPEDLVATVMPYFDDPNVGAVAPRVAWTNARETAITVSGGIYWRFEEFLWHHEGRLGLMAWAPGMCMAIRRELLRPMPEAFGDDAIIPLWVVAAGKRIEYARQIVVASGRPVTPREEFRARVRMTTRSLGAILHVWTVRRAMGRPMATWAIVSHKVMRWATPLFIALAVLLNAVLLASRLYQLTFSLEVLAFLGALAGWWNETRSGRVRTFGALYSFVLVNIAFAIGIWRAVGGKTITIFQTSDS